MKCDVHPSRPALLTHVNKAAGIYKRQCLECRMAEIVMPQPSLYRSPREAARNGILPWGDGYDQ